MKNVTSKNMLLNFNFKRMSIVIGFSMMVYDLFRRQYNINFGVKIRNHSSCLGFCL